MLPIRDLSATSACPGSTAHRTDRSLTDVYVFRTIFLIRRNETELLPESSGIKYVEVPVSRTTTKSWIQFSTWSPAKLSFTVSSENKTIWDILSHRAGESNKGKIMLSILREKNVRFLYENSNFSRRSLFMLTIAGIAQKLMFCAINLLNIKKNQVLLWINLKTIF